MEQVNQSLPVFNLADLLLGAREEKDRLAAATKENNQEIERIEKELLEQMRVNELENFKRAGKLFYATNKTYASPKAENKEQVYQWLKDNGYGDLVKETVNANTFSSWVNERIEEDGELPEELTEKVNLLEKISVTVRKG